MFGRQGFYSFKHLPTSKTEDTPRRCGCPARMLQSFVRNIFQNCQFSRIGKCPNIPALKAIEKLPWKKSGQKHPTTKDTWPKDDASRKGQAPTCPPCKKAPCCILGARMPISVSVCLWVCVWVSVCRCVGVCVCEWVCVCGWMCVWVDVCVGGCVCGWVSVWVCVWVDECGWVCVWVGGLCGWVSVCVGRCVCEWVGGWVCVCGWKWVGVLKFSQLIPSKFCGSVLRCRDRTEPLLEFCSRGPA